MRIKKFATLIVALLALSGCEYIGSLWESEEAREEKVKKHEAELAQSRADSAEMFYRRHAVLLSLKYKIDEEKVFNILQSSADLYSLTGEEVHNFLYGKGYKERITALSDEHGIPPDLIANILIDYYAMQSC